MSNHHQSDHNIDKLRDALFDALEDQRTGMLGVQGAPSHMQPMTHYTDDKAHVLRFITARDTDLAREIGTSGTAHFTVTSKDTYACMKGTIRPVDDRATLESLWSPAADMWFEGGIDDPSVLLLEMPLDDAAVWTVDANALQFGIEMIRANLSEDHQPDLGDHGIVPLRAA